jgi:uncharacterized protein (TIGR04255 family)
MATQRHLNSAPIKEAIIDLRVQLPQKFKVENFEKLISSLKQEYPSAKPRHKLEFKHEFKEGKILSDNKDYGIDGYILKSTDGEKIVQFRNDGFTFSRLKPYPTWDEIFSQAKKLWILYVDCCLPVSVTRIATRYINHIDIPIPIDDFSKYLISPPTVPEGLPQNISGFLSRIVVNDTRLSVSANITQAFEKSIKEEHITLILDIDVYKVKNFDVSDDFMWENFDHFHKLKNDIFFGYLTDAVLEDYK